jgi:hypothetical protein
LVALAALAADAGKQQQQQQQQQHLLLQLCHLQCRTRFSDYKSAAKPNLRYGST